MSAAQRKPDPMRSLQESIDRLSARIESIEGNGGLGDKDQLTRHIRRYVPFYALAAVFALLMLALPTKAPNGEQTDTAGQVTQDTAGDIGGTTDGNVAASSGTSSSSRVGGGGVTVGATGSSEVVGTGSTAKAAFDPLAWKLTGKTKGNFDCVPNVRQLPWSRYAAPCYPRWTGTNNGGATNRGVTKDKIVIVNRTFPDTAASAAVDQFVQAAGFASSDEFVETRVKFVGYFNKVFELWGRQVKWIEYKSEYGNSTDESLGSGKEGACQDADSVISKYKPYAVISGSAVFGECGAARKMMVLGAGAYYPNWWYQKHHPYIWAGVMECERIAHMGAEYLGKRIVHYKAKWAKSLQKDLPRVIGLYVPTNVEYQSCVDMSDKDLKTKYNYKKKISQYNYRLDISRFADEAQRAIVQFQADGVTTIFLACDPLSPIFLTQDATNQQFQPEWITNSAGLTDVDQFARLWDQFQIQGKLFGMSQLGDNAKILGPKGEGTTAYKKAFGTDIPPGTQTEYYSTMGIFSILQATGPILTYLNQAATYPRLPPGGAPEYEVGYTAYNTNPEGNPGFDHTAVDDMREIYWVCTSISGDPGGTSRCNGPKGYDGKGGVYKVTYGGKRFRPGQWPKGEPQIYKHGTS